MKLNELNEPVGDPTLIRILYDGNEYKVISPTGREEESYFTDDLDDAKGTARLMYGDNLIFKIRRVPVVE